MKTIDITINTLTEKIIATKCRKGKSEAITKNGAYWLACEPITIKRFGGDGIGQTRPDYTNYLELRHYRDGTVRATIQFYSWHQNEGSQRSYKQSPVLLAETVEDVIIALKNEHAGNYDYDNSNCVYSDRCYDKLSTALMAIGLPEYPVPSPDEENPPIA